MKLVILDPYNAEEVSILKNNVTGEFVENLNVILLNTSRYSKEEYLSVKNNSNDINECLMSINGSDVSNFCFFNGTKDNKLVQMSIKNLQQREFVEQSLTYAFDRLDAETVTVFSKENYARQLDNLGFENLGEYNGVNTYVKDRVLEENMGRVR